MSLILKYDKSYYTKEGFISLKRGDDWKLSGKIIDRKGSYEQEVDLSLQSASAFFAGDNGNILVPVTIDVPKAGEFSLFLASSGSLGVSLAPNGISSYIILKSSDNTIQTIETEDQPFQIEDRGFKTF